jgi:hypothetical protein
MQLTGFIFALAAALPLSASPIKTVERERLLAHFELTEAWLTDETHGLTDAQLKFRAAPDKWSVLDCVEHLAIAEAQYWKDLQDSLKTEATSKKALGTDGDVLWYGIDRTVHQKTGDARVPDGRYKTLAAALNDFKKQRKTMLEYARATQEDLHAHLMPGEQIDSYQWFVMISSHAQRHILQIREIKADPNFPKG